MVLIKRSKTWADADSADTQADKEHLDGVAEELTEATESLEAATEDMKATTAKKANKSFFKTGKFLFPLGISLGIIMGFALIEPTDIHDMQAQIGLLMNEYDISMPQIPGLDFTRVEVEWKRLKSNIPELWKFSRDGREFMVGDAIKARGLTAEYPVVLIPGIISTGLESWSTSPAYRAFFREKVWGGFNMVSQVTFNKDQWISAMMLDPDTGLDPPNVKVRAAEGLDAASSFIQGYWIWQKVIENLAVVNYDTNNMHLAPYDWRLSYSNLEVRDGYFSRLKSTIEGFKRRQGKKTVVVAHSMGATVLLYFFKWVESPDHGGGGSDWVENNIEAYISIAGTHLGVPKAMTAFLSGEMKDTVQINPAGAYVLEQFFSRKERQKLFRSWAGSASMWIKGGIAIWGNETHAPDDPMNATHTHGKLIGFRQNQNMSIESTGEPTGNMTAEDAGIWILEHTPPSFQKMLASNYSYGIEKNQDMLRKNNADHTKWSNPLEVALPNAPSMKIYCVYGHGKETERSYWYARGSHEHDEDFAEASSPTCDDTTSGNCAAPEAAMGIPLSRRSWIDSEYTDAATSPKIINGVKLGEGDGTVSLLSLGAMCVDGWKRPRWNPAGIPVTTVELPHQPVLSIPRGGANTSDHVDILGSTGINEILLKVATGVGHEIEERYVSNIREYSSRINWD